MGLIEDLLSGGSPQPEQLSGPAPDPSGSDWTQAIAGGLAGGISGYNRAPLLAILGMQEQEQRKRMVDLQSKQEGYKQVAQLSDLLRQPIANRKLLTASAIKNGVLPKEYGDLISKATDEQAQGLADTLSQWARETPNFNADMLRGILQHMPSHEMGLTLFQLDQQRRQEAQSKVANEIQAGGGGTPTPDQLSGPQAQPQDEGAALAQGISALGAQLQAVGNQRQAILTRVTDPAAQKAALANLNTAEDNIRGRIGQLQSRQNQMRQEKEDLARERRHQEDKVMQRENMNRLAGQFAQSLAQQGANQDRIDARQQNLFKMFMERPLDTATQKDIAAIESIARQINNVETTYKPEFLGPVRGQDTTFNARSMAGGMVGMGVGEDETIFRQSLADLSDQLLRARSGAQINETEYARLKNMLPKATDEEPKFKAGMKRFKTEMNALLESKIKLGTSTRRQVGEASGSGTPKGPTTAEEYLKKFK